jgi:hypothetical protein
VRSFALLSLFVLFLFRFRSCPPPGGGVRTPHSQRSRHRPSGANGTCS